ncbi:hypothetical protein BBJ28_00001296 [Nothophytophthora sp. Chile5]|nr:hypothetical protein BBJ28_00001296 [Nothophytophthora sp. Chile5]
MHVTTRPTLAFTCTKDVEFQRAEHRMTGIGCRLLYLHAVWLETYNATAASLASTRSQTKVFLESNGFPEFEQRLEVSCVLMGYDVVADALEADLVFVYVAPPSEQRSASSQFEIFQRLVEHSKSEAADHATMFCFLFGDADFLALPMTDEDERLRGLSDFAISQQFAPIAEDAKYKSVAQFAVEFVPSNTANTSAEFQEEKTRQLDALMDKFGCVGQNLMHHTEKWEFYAPRFSAFCREEEDEAGITYPSEEDALFWFQQAKGKTCDQCYAPNDKLFRCARCQDVLYCSRECQKAAWRLHKQLCGKTPEQIRASNEEDTD